MKIRQSSPSRPLFAILLLGALALAAGVTLARSWLPEWQPGVRDKSFYVQRYKELARTAGIRLTPGEPRATLTVQEDREDDEQSKRLDNLGAEKEAALGEGARIKVAHSGTPPGTDNPREILIELSPGGQPLVLDWKFNVAKAIKENFRMPPVARQRLAALARLMLAPGERLGKPSEGETTLYDIVGSDPPQIIEVKATSSEIVTIRREIREEKGSSDDSPWRVVPLVVLIAVPHVIGALTLIVLFFRFIAQRRIDYANGLFLGALYVVTSIPGVISMPTWQDRLNQGVGGLFMGLWLMISWSVGESYLRSVRPSFGTALDALRLRRLGPRGGLALLSGVGLGALLAGLRLGTFVLAEALPGIRPDEPTVRFPLLAAGNPFCAGPLLVSAMALALALALRYVSERWAPWMAAFLGGFFLALVYVSLNPVPAWVVANLAMAGFLIWVLWRFGLTTTLVTATASYLLPAAIFSTIHLAWLPVPFAMAAGSSVALIVLGGVGLSRPEQIEMEGRKAPAFLRRIEDERRLKHEMDLLSRMQLGLLPARVPEVPGWEIAVRTLLATEAGGDLYDFLEDEEGGFWIAAGDVAGHGYSCSIAQSMTTASLASLIHADQTPPSVLHKIDQVLRRNAAHRHFTSLALVRLDPRTGEGTLANAGHPFPLLLVDGEVTEIAAAGLPLGQGPRRQYRETPVQIPPGGILVFCSDGLFEGTDWQEVPYGYDRPRELLKTLGGKSAAEILEALFADWRRHLGAQEHQDDTTVVVIKRL